MTAKILSFEEAKEAKKRKEKNDILRRILKRPTCMIPKEPEEDED